MDETRDQKNRRALSTDHLLADLKGRTMRSGLVNIAGQLTAMVLQLGSSAILARLLAPADYGLLAMAATAVALSAMLTNLGLTIPTIQRPHITHEQVSTLFYVNIAGGLILFLLSCASTFIFERVFDDPRVPMMIVTLSLTIPMAAIAAQFNAVMARNMQWLKLQAIYLVSLVLSSVLAILLAWKAGWGAYALLAQVLSAGFLTMVLTIILCPWRPSLHFDLKSIRSELSTGIDITVYGILNFAQLQMDNVLVGATGGATQLGLYSRGYNLMTQASSIITGPVTKAILPSLSRLSDNMAAWRSHFLELAALTAGGCGLLFTALWAARAPIVSILLGPKWEGVVPIFGYLLVAGLATSVCTPFSWTYITLGRTRQQLHWISFAAPVLVGGFWIGSYYGAVGVALAYAVVTAGLNFAYLRFALTGSTISYGEGLTLKLAVYASFAAGVGVSQLVQAAMPPAHPFVVLIIMGFSGAAGYLLAFIPLAHLVPVYTPARTFVYKLIARLIGKPSLQ